MAKQKNIQQQEGLVKLLMYILGQRPDEFGLYPDAGGFVAVKNLMAALHDEDGWRGLREAQVAMLANLPGGESLFEIAEGKMRLRPEMASSPPPAPPIGPLPGTLYLPLKPSAWPVISERGLFPKAGEAAVLLWRDREQALKIGRRQSPQPVVAAIKTGPALSGGTLFRPYSELLWLTGRVEARFLAGPPTPPKEETPSRGAKDDKTTALPGSFYLETPSPEVHRGKKKGKHGDAPDWKNQIRRDRRRHGE